MANVTVTGGSYRLSDAAFSARLAGEDVAIASGAIVTVDCDVQGTTNPPLMGRFSITEGEVIVDARGTRLLDYTVGIGTLTLFGTVTGASSGATGVVISAPGSMSGTLKLRNVTGNFINGEMLSGTGGWTGFCGGTQRLGYLLVLMETGQNSVIPLLGKISCYGSWYKLGVGNGNASQTLNHFSTAAIAGCWIQKGFTFAATGGNANLTFSYEDFIDGQAVRLFTSGTLPSNFATGTQYFIVKTTDARGRTLTIGLSATVGGTLVTPSNSGSGTHTVVAVGNIFTASGSTITVTGGHRFTNGDEVILESTGTLYSGVDIFTSYFVVNSNQTTGTLGLALTAGGTAISLSGGSGTHTIVPISNLDRWVNIDAVAFTAHGVGGDVGRVFQQTMGSTTLTFGNGTNGNVIPNGAAVYVPNLQIGTATTAAPTTPSTTTATTTMTNGGTWYSRTTLLSAFSLTAWGIKRLDMVNCGNLHAISINKALDAINLQNFISSHGANTGGNYIYCRLGKITINGLLNIGRASGNQPAYIGDSLECAISNATFMRSGRSSSNDEAVRFQRLTGSAQKLTIIGAVARLENCANFTIDDVSYADQAIGGTTTNTPMAIFAPTNSADISISNLKILAGSPPRTALIETSNIARLTLLNTGTFTNPLDCLGHTLSIIGFGTKAISQPDMNTADISAVLCTNVGNFFSVNAASTNQCINYRFKDSGAGYSAGLSLQASQSDVRGGRFTIGNTTSYAGLIGTHFFDGFNSTTAGVVGIFITPILSTDPNSANYVTIDAGTPVFDGQNALFMRTLGDQITWTFPYFVKGYTAFANAAFAVAQVSNQGNHTFTYRLDTGSGFSGAFKILNATNLTAESISPSGFRLQIRVSCNTANANNAIRQFFTIPMVTTANDQNQILYPLTKAVTLKITNAVSGAHCVIIRNSNGARLLDAIANSQGEASTNYEYVVGGGDIAATAKVRLAGYKPFEVPVTITSTGVTVPAVFPIDSSYAA